MPIQKIIDRWNIFAIAAAALCTCIGGFLIPPPLYQNQTSYHFAVFLVTLLVALWSIPVSLWNARANLKAWSSIAVVFFALSLSGYFFYDQLLSSWTFFYPPKSVLVERAIHGITLSDDAKKCKDQLIAAGESAGPADLVWCAGGDIAAVWPNSNERESFQRGLEWTYFALCLVFASAVVSTVQATFCVNQTDNEGPADHTAQSTDNNAPLHPAPATDSKGNV